MNKPELIEALIAGLERDNPRWAREGIREHLRTFSLETLQNRYDKGVAAGEITPPPNQQDIAAAKLKAQQLAQDAIKRSPEYAENQKLREELNRNQVYGIIFTTKVPQAENRTAKDCIANRETIREWAEAETTPVTDVR